MSYNRPSFSENKTGLLKIDNDVINIIFKNKNRILFFEKKDGSLYIYDPSYPKTTSGFKFIPLSREEFEKKFSYLIKETKTKSIYFCISEVTNLNQFKKLGEYTVLVYDEAD